MAKKRKNVQDVAVSDQTDAKTADITVKPTSNGIGATAAAPLKPKNGTHVKDVTRKKLKRQHNDAENVVSGKICKKDTKTDITQVNENAEEIKQIREQQNIDSANVVGGDAVKSKKKKKIANDDNVEIAVSENSATVNMKNNNVVDGDAKAPKKKKTKLDKNLLNGNDQQAESDDVGIEKNPADAKPGLNINKAVFRLFKSMQTEKINQKHLDALIQLIKNESDLAKRNATCAYALKRLIRCTGADDRKAVALNASYMNGVLGSVPGIDLVELLLSMKRDLPVGNQLKGKEESLASVGQVITAYSIIETEHLKEAKPLLLKAVYDILFSQMRGREYLINMTAQVIINSFKQVSVATFRTYVWPLLEPMIIKHVGAQKLLGFDLLLAVYFSFPTLLTRERLGEIIWGNKPPQYETYFDLYLNSMPNQNDGTYERLAKFFTVEHKLLHKWMERINTTPPKLYAAKICVIKVATYTLLNCAELEEPVCASLFREPFLNMLLAEMQAVSHKRMVVKATQQQMQKACSGFETALLLGFEKTMKHNHTKVSLLRSLMQLNPFFDTLTQTPRLTQQLIGKLDVDGLKEVYELFLAIYLTKNEEGMPKTGKSVRMICLNQMQFILQHSRLDEERKQQSDWLKQQMEFLMLTGLFHMDDEQQICTAAEAAEYSKETAARCEEIFFNCVLHKANNVLQLCQVLRTYTKTLATRLGEDNAAAKLRVPHNEEALKSWKVVEKTLKSPCKKDSDLLGLAYEALLLFLGLTLHTRTNLPAVLLSDIKICQKRCKNEHAGKGKQEEDELPWQDVITDALLLLQVQSGHFWRQFVSTISTVMFKHLNKDNLEQMLQALNMSKNPLGEQDDSESESGDDTDSNSDSSTDDEADENEEDHDDTAETRLEQVRENVRLALTQDGDDDDGASSVDWNDVDEAEGARLNAALEQAFQAFKPKQRPAKKQQLTKAERISSTTLLHFRMRVLEMVELFVTQQPCMEHVIDALCTIFQVYKFCSNDAKHASLHEVSKKHLKKLLSLKIDSTAASKQPLIDTIKFLMSTDDTEQPTEQEPKHRPTKNTNNIVAEWRNNCVAYLVSQFNIDEKSDNDVWPLLEGYLLDWVRKRSCSHMLATFECIFKSHWKGVGNLAIRFAAQLQPQLRAQRRMQILGLLLKHHNQIRAALANSKKSRNSYDTHIADYATQLMQQTGDGVKKEMQSVTAILPHGGEKCSIVLHKWMDAKKKT